MKELPKISLSLWVEVLGASAVVISLIFVALEIRQNTEALSAQSLLELNRLGNDVFRDPMVDEELMQIVIKGYEDRDLLTKVEEARFRYYVYSTMNNLEVAFMHNNRGILPDEDYAAWRFSTCRYISRPSVLRYWQDGEILFIPKFNLFVEESCGLEGPDVP